MYRLIGLSCLALVACGDNNPVPPPTLQNVSVTTAEDTAASVVVPLTASNPSQVTLSVTTAPVHGTLTGTGPTWTYRPTANYAGPDSIVVKADDSHGSATATVTITVTPVNDAPVANGDSFATGFDAPLTVAFTTLLANDTDVDSTTLTVTAVAAPPDANGTPVMTGGNVVFTPTVGFTGAAKFTYTVSDGALTATATVSVTVGADLAPVANDDAAITDEDVTLTITDATLLANDTDPDNQTPSISAVGNAVNGTVSHTGTQVTFIPDAEFSGTASFEYTITDGMLTDTAVVTIAVAAVDDPPSAADDIATVAEGTTLNLVDVLANDTDIDGGPRTVASVTQPPNGTTAVGAGGTGLTYTSAANYCNEAPNVARDSFTYTLNGGSTATVSVKVTCACGLQKSTDFVVGSN